MVDRSAASRNPLGPQTDNGAMEHGDAETAKTATEVAAIIAQPVNRRRRGKYLVGLCPSHEKSPLFTITRLTAAGRVHVAVMGALMGSMAALRGLLPPAVLLDVERLERHRKRPGLRSTGRSHENAAYQCARLSIPSMVGAPPLVNAPPNRTTEICRRECSRRMSRGRAPPILPKLAAAPQSGQIRPQRQTRSKTEGRLNFKSCHIPSQ